MSTAIDAGRAEVAAFMTRLYQQGLTTTSGGNISLRLDEDTVLITAAGTDKGRMSAADVAVMRMTGENQTPGLKPSSESAMHLEILRQHAGVRAIVHAHPPAASSFCVADRRLNSHLIAEAYALVGEPVFAPYALTGTAELARNVAGCIGPQTACVLMENHGVLAVGGSLLEAFDRLEVLDNLARIQIYASVLGDSRELSLERLRELDELMGRPGGPS